MRATTFEEAWKSGEIDDSFIESYMCPICPWTLGEIGRDADSVCEGSYCEEAFEECIYGA